MSRTPEAIVKDKTRQILAEYDGLYSHWPVPSGFGKRTVDCLGCYRGRFFAIEVKAPGKKPTLNQSRTLQQIDAAMGRTFVIDGVDCLGLVELRDWLDVLTIGVPDDHHLTPDPVSRRTI